MSDSVIEVIKTRRSIRKWKDKAISKESIQEVIACGQHAPSAFDEQPWDFIVIRDGDKIQELLEDRVQKIEDPYDINSRDYARHLNEDEYEKPQMPPVLIAVLGDRSICPYEGSLLYSTACCVQNMLLASHALGLGATWLYVYDPDTPHTERGLRDKLDVHDDQTVMCFVALGYPDVNLSEKEVRKNNVRWE